MRKQKDRSAERAEMSRQLGMNITTARSRLVADLLYSFVERLGIVCHRCGEVMSRQTVSIEHKTAWLGEPNSVELYFDLRNIAFSHLACNKRAARKPTKKVVVTDHGNYVNFSTRICSCDLCRDAWNAYKRLRYTPESRRAKYARTGT